MQQINPLDYLVSLSYPDRTAPSTWLKHVPFGMFLVEVLRPKVLVELGTYAGTSYCAFCHAVKALGLDTKCYAIDTWKGDPQSGYYDSSILEDLRAYHDPLYGSFSYLLQSTFDEALAHFEDGTVDLLHIDGYHTYEAVRHDFECWLPKMSSQGVILFHDISVREKDFGAWKVWEELKRSYPSFEMIHEHGLGVLAVGSSYPEPFQALLNLPENHRASLRELFLQLGMRLELAEKCRSLKAQITEVQRQSEVQQQQVVNRQEALLNEAALRAEAERAALLEQHQQVLRETAVRTETERAALLEQHQQVTTRAEAKRAALVEQHQRALQAAATRAEVYRIALLDQHSKALQDVIARAEAERAALVEQHRQAQQEATARTEAEHTALKAHYEALIASLNEQLQQVTRLVETLQYEVTRMRATRGWRILERWWRLKKSLIPDHARRYYARQLLQTSVTIFFKQGPFAFANRLRLWLRGERRYRNALVAPRPEIKTPLVEEQASAPITPITAQAQQERLPDSPDFTGVSIVIPVFNALDYAMACVASVYAAGSQTPFELIIVDNGSEEEVFAWMQAESQKRDCFWWIRVPQNLGFAKAANLGARHARGRYVVILNSDTVVTSGWLDALVRAAESDAAIGVLSPVTNYVGEGLQIDETARDLTVDQVETYAATIKDRTEVILVPERMAFFCVMIRSQVLRMLGGLDEGFGPGNFEDDDFCVRARLAGFKLAVVPNSFVFHHGSKTFVANKIDHSQWMVRNYLRYLSRLTDYALTPIPRVRRPLNSTGDAVQISVIVCTVNRPNTLRAALTSLANQTLDCFEVILVNDGGQDVSEIAAEFRHRLTITYLQNRESEGRAAALNKAIDAARGYWIACLDDDDIVYPFHLEALWATLVRSKGKYHFAYSDYNRTLLADREPAGPILSRVAVPTWRFNPNDLYVRNYIPVHCWMQRRQCLIDMGGFKAALWPIDDWDYLIRLSAHYEFTPTRRISSEYRFYLDMGNSMVKQRERVLYNLHRIYEQHPVSDPQILSLRQRESQDLEQQIAEIKRLKQHTESNPESQHAMLRQMLSLIAGFN